MREFTIRDINEMAISCRDGKPYPYFENHIRLASNTDAQMVENFHKCCDWVRAHYPNLTKVYNVSHDVYTKVDIEITNGSLILCCGSHGYGYSHYISDIGSAIYSQGSCQGRPYLFIGVYGFPKESFIKFFERWQRIKGEIIEDGELLNKITSGDFQP